MARMPNGLPRSVPDPYSDEYDDMMRRWLADIEASDAGLTDLAADQPKPSTSTASPGKSLPGQIGDAFRDWQKGARVGHPGLAESFVPVWGSGREALADLQEGDYTGAALNGGLAVTDVIPAKAVAGALEKGAWKGAPYASRATRKWLGKQGYAGFGQHMHHWAIPQNGWGKAVPDWIKNQPWDLKAMPSPQVHGRIHGPYKAPQYNLQQRLWYGTPAWAKAIGAETVGRPAAGAWEESKEAR
jgi:hypothetical protein